MRILLLLLILLYGGELVAQSKLPRKTKEQKRAEKRLSEQETAQERMEKTLMWNPRQAKYRKHGLTEVSPWHNGTAGILASRQGEISLLAPTRIGFSRKTEWLFRIVEMPFLPNVGLKHQWWKNRRLALATEHTLYYTYPLFKMLQTSGFKALVPDTVSVPQQGAMRCDLLFSWLINPRIEGCPVIMPEMILTWRGGAEFNLWNPQSQIRPFDYFHTLYHTQLLDNKVLYYTGLQFDSYFSYRFRYSLNGLYYTANFTKAGAIEANARLTYRLSPHLGISAAAKGAYIRIQGSDKFTCLPLLDLTYYVRPGRGVVKTDLFKRKRRYRR